MAKRYTVGYVNESTPPLSGHARTIATVMEEELGVEPFSRKTLEGMIRIIADGKGFGKYINVDLAFKDLTESGFLVYEGHL